ncbi:glycosyltransferase family 4 protein [Atlantibacter hermannii]|uniref:glycosyltransferase family 4 protein n=1 Tax=Atlantibacter hermannii TaxID=565 RepID=UPI0028A1C1ED|nr:glycosyltransferase [Atlantibacter hermannii]
MKKALVVLMSKTFNNFELLNKKIEAHEKVFFVTNSSLYTSKKNKVIFIKDIVRSLNAIEDFPYEELIFIGADRYHFPDELLRDVFSKNLSKVEFFDENLCPCEYGRFKNVKSESISCFPGAIFPINMGSHQRAFGILKYLNENEKYTDVLITAGNEKQLIIAKMLLKLIAPKVYTYKNNRKKLSKLLRLRRYIDNKINITLFRKQRSADTFEESLNFKATTSSKRTLAKLHDQNKYQNIIVNYAWMQPILEYTSLENEVLICDTHDVQYIRNKSTNGQNLRVFVSTSREKRKEIESLKKFNYVMAISQPDHEEFSKNLSNSMLVTSGFDYAYLPPKTKSSRSPINFGFIGGGMEANVLSLSHVIKNWWPSIVKFSPKSKLYIAGSICNNNEIRELAFLDDSIVLMGFVDSLSKFYTKFDISLNPVFIKGGLNFKSVESMAAGKILFTNPMGNDCLRLNKPVRIVKNVNEVISELIKFDRDKKYMNAEMRLSQKVSLKHFSDATAYKNLVEVLK